MQEVSPGNRAGPLWVPDPKSAQENQSICALNKGDAKAKTNGIHR
jgi:hypothetical protein